MEVHPGKDIVFFIYLNEMIALSYISLVDTVLLAEVLVGGWLA